MTESTANNNYACNCFRQSFTVVAENTMYNLNYNCFSEFDEVVVENTAV